jgi:type 1 glutamine amidotransferase
VSLPEGDVDGGGYKWIEGIKRQLVNLAPDHFITTHKVSYLEQVAFKADTDATERTLPGFTLKESEVYLNHGLTEDQTRTLLLGLKYTDKDSGKTYMQSHAGWVKQSGKGWIVYLQPGHDLHDLTHPTFERILLNAVVWKP